MTHPTLPHDPPLIGRTGELARLDALVAATGQGGGGAVRIWGEAGVGKTRLVTEALAAADLPISWGAAEEAERARPFAAFSRALDLPDLHQVAATNAAALSGDATWLAIDQIVAAVERRAGRGPSIVVLDDLQWADHGTWAAAAALARRAPTMGLLIVILHRPLLPSDTTPVPLAALGEEIELGPLAPREALKLAASVMATLPHGTAAAQVGRAAGNPFFTIEIARWLDSNDPETWTDAPAGEVELSPVLRSTVLHRVDQLDPTTISVLRSAALLGRRTTVSEVSALTSQPPAVVARSVEDATAVGLLVDNDLGFGFRHDLVRAAVRATVPAAVVAAQLASATRTATADPWSVRQLAQGATPGDHDAARIAARTARGPDVDPATAADLLEEVLRIGLGPAEEPGTIETDLVLAIGRTGDLDAASARGHALLDEHSAHGDDFDGGRSGGERAVEANDGADAAVRLRQLAPLRRLLARVDLGRGRVDEAVAELSLVATLDGPIAEQAQADLYLLEVMTFRRPDAAEDARGLLKRTSDPDVRCNANLAVAVHAMRTDQIEESVSASTVAVAQAAIDPLLTAEIHPEIFLANALFYAERFEEASSALAHAQIAGERAGVVWPIPHHLAHAAGAALRVGDLEAARTASSEAIEWSIDTGQRIGATWPHVFTAVVAVHTGELDDARISLELAEEDLAAGRWQGTEAVPWAAALVAEADGDHTAAAKRLVPIVELGAAFGWNNRIPLLAPDAARMAWMAGDTEAVDRMVQVAESVATSEKIDGRAAHLRCLGLASSSVDQLAEAADCYDGLGSATAAATTWAEAVVVAARTGHHDTSLELFEREARPRLEAIGATGIIERISAAVPVRVRRRLGRQPQRPDHGTASLTPAERRVTELVATGATNSDIAVALVVSRRTVESHLSRVYRKLGVASRVHLAVLDLDEAS